MPSSRPLVALVPLLAAACTRAQVSLADATALVKHTAVVYASPEAGAVRIAAWPVWTTGRVIARGEDCLPDGEGTCTDRWLVRTGWGQGWVGGADLLVRDSVELLPGSPGTGALDGPPSALDGSVVPAVAWYGVTPRWEWTPDYGRDRADFQGMLVVPGPSGPKTLDLGYISGWGSADYLGAAAWRDLDGDGRAELLVQIGEDATEVGFVGDRLEVFGGDLSTRLVVPAGNPTLNGLEQDRYGAIRAIGTRIVHEEVASTPCDPPLAPPESVETSHFSTSCVTGTRTTWERLVAHTEPLPLHAEGLPIVAFHHEDGPVEGSPHPLVLVRAPTGYRWLRDPAFDPPWLAATFGGSPGGETWVDLFPDR